MTSFNIHMRRSKAGVERALYRSSTIGAGAFPLHDAAHHLLRTGIATAADTLKVHRGRTFHRAVLVGAVATGLPV